MPVPHGALELAVAQQKLAGGGCRCVCKRGRPGSPQAVSAVGDLGSIIAIQRPTRRAYCLVPACSPVRLRLGKSQSSARTPRTTSRAIALRVSAVSSNGTGWPVFCCMTVARGRTTARRRRSPASQIAAAQLCVDRTVEQSKVAQLAGVSRCSLIAQMCFGFSGGFGPIAGRSSTELRRSVRAAACNTRRWAAVRAPDFTAERLGRGHWDRQSPAFRELIYPSGFLDVRYGGKRTLTAQGFGR